MRTQYYPPNLFLLLIAATTLCLLIGGVTLAQGLWVDEIGNSIQVYKSLYPTSDFDPYEKQLALVKVALNKGDKKGVRTEMGKWFKMLRTRAHGIDAIAADELINFAVMVTPVQEYNISVPRR